MAPPPVAAAAAAGEEGQAQAETPAPVVQTPAAKAGYVDVARAESRELRKSLQVFREFDTSGDGLINASELQAALQQLCGKQISAREARRLISDVTAGGRQEIDFSEFIALSRKQIQAKYKAKGPRQPRAYLSAETYDKYSAMFMAKAGADAMLDVRELREFLAEYGISVPADRLKQIMSEVDDDNSGFLEETEFLILLIKAMGLKKRKVGPGHCPPEQLVQEGWPLADVKRLGYEYSDFVALGYALPELMEFFSIAELKRGGVGVEALVDQGWNCAKAREAGFQLADLVQCGCTARQIWVAGWTEAAAVAELRRLGMPCEQLRSSGWALSELRRAGFSAADLASAGFSHEAIAAVDATLVDRTTQARRDTFNLRRAAAR